VILSKCSRRALGEGPDDVETCCLATGQVGVGVTDEGSVRDEGELGRAASEQVGPPADDSNSRGFLVTLSKLVSKRKTELVCERHLPD
jgi:hypothetical protein